MLPIIQLGGRLHHDLDMQVTAPGTAQAPHAQAGENHLIAALSARLDRHGPLAVQGRQWETRSQRRRRHGHAQFGVQVVASAREGLIAGLVDLDIQITVRTAGRTGFATPGHADTGSRGHSGRDVDINGGMHALAALAVAFAARRGDHSAEALTARARGGGHHVAQEGALHALNGALAIALRAGHRPGALGAA